MNNSARESILGSIRTHLAASPALDVKEHQAPSEIPAAPSSSDPVNRFKESVESVSGHCIVTRDVTDVLSRIIADLKAERIANSDNPPNAHEIFGYDVGISTAQVGIAETGTLVLDSACERHRLVSLVPPVHIAIVNASAIVETLSDALTLLQKKEISPAITFITGPSRTADIELTLAIGVHGPQELYVIVDGSK
ncbi:MAG TPA: lactate utilization protein [Pyrinomonadaceae bacterium]|nr:lactate utilization protein [Pyrinomonadaceae bacterium]